MPNKTLSVRDEDLPLWERAEQAAKHDRTSVSALVASALAEKLGTTGTCRVVMYELATPYRWEMFEGRWLAGEPEFDGCEWQNERGWDHRTNKYVDSETYVAETARGRIAIYVRHYCSAYDKPPALHIFEDIDSAKKALASDPRVNQEVLTAASYALARNGRRSGEEVRWRDI